MYSGDYDDTEKENRLGIFAKVGKQTVYILSHHAMTDSRWVGGGVLAESTPPQSAKSNVMTQ